MKAGYLIDMDGVIYRENQLLPGAADFVEALLSGGTAFLFLTNNSAPTPDDLSLRLHHLGVAGVTPRHFYTSALNTADFLAEVHPACTAFAIGEGGLLSALHERRIPNDSIRPDYVVVGEGQATTEKLTKAHELIERGARLVATNPDNWCPVGAEKTRPGAGATAAYLEASTGRRAYYLGKPNGYMFQRARRKLADAGLGPGEPAIMIGDTMETDIRGAVEAGFPSFLVLTGSTDLGSIGDYVYQPSRVIDGVHSLVDELRHGRANEWKPYIGTRQDRVTANRVGGRHQTDFLSVAKPRPRPAMTK